MKDILLANRTAIRFLKKIVNELKQTEKTTVWIIVGSNSELNNDFTSNCINIVTPIKQLKFLIGSQKNEKINR